MILLDPSLTDWLGAIPDHPIVVFATFLVSALSMLAGVTRQGRRVIVAVFTFLVRLVRNLSPFRLARRLKAVEEQLEMLELSLQQTLVNALKESTDKITNAVSSLEEKQSYMDTEQRLLREAEGKMTWRSDGEGKLVYASPTLCDLVGAQPFDFLGDGWVTFIHPDDQERIHKSRDTAVAQERAYLQTYRLVDKRLSKVYTVRDYAKPVRNNGHGIIGFVGVIELVDASRP